MLAGKLKLTATPIVRTSWIPKLAEGGNYALGLLPEFLHGQRVNVLRTANLHNYFTFCTIGWYVTAGIRNSYNVRIHKVNDMEPLSLFEVRWNHSSILYLVFPLANECRET